MPIESKRRKRNRPPLPGGFSTKNSHTSPKRIALRRRQSEALRFREQGYNYEQIAKHMKTNPSTVYRWVMAAMDRITAEPARRVLDLELRRLDALPPQRERTPFGLWEKPDPKGWMK